VNREINMSVNAKSSNRVRQISYYAALFLIALAPACRKAKNYSWQQVYRTVGCEPRTPQAKTQVGDCPKLADLTHPTPEEAREYVDYMNRRDAVEGTLNSGQLEGPGCLQWRINITTDRPEVTRTGKKEGCSNLQPLQNYKVP
jgi:hypothetical protein